MMQNKLCSLILIATLTVLFTAFIVVSSATGDLKLNEIQNAIDTKSANWIAGETSVSCLSEEEKRKLCGLIYHPDGPPRAEEKGEPVIKGQPASFDWRYAGGDWTTSIKSQGTCGSCWAFGSLAVLETQINIEGNDPTIDTNLAEQYMLSCSAGDCVGYTLPGTMDFLKDTGTTDEACFPYQADDGVPCSDACTYCDGRMWKITSWGYITPNRAAVKEKIQEAPVVAGMMLYEDFYDYIGGVYEHVSGVFMGYHLIAIVGWDDANECWICKNSWGTGWGEDGWFRIKYGECGLATTYSNCQAYSIFELPKKVISCDSGGMARDIFIAGDSVYIEALGLSPSTEYKVWIQPNPVTEGDSLVSGKDPSPSQETVSTDANGNIFPLLIWSIPADASATNTEYDIVLDNQYAGTVGTYNAADDAIDSSAVTGILAPVPELATLILFSVGLLVLVGYVVLKRKLFV
ncbi:Cysteine protease, C1A family [Methanophagales archaeon]|nr:Cysteine protease, C1A family [Methanophagales archaeon]